MQKLFNYNIKYLCNNVIVVIDAYRRYTYYLSCTLLIVSIKLIWWLYWPLTLLTAQFELNIWVCH